MGDRPTMVDVARAAGVSTALVSIVMRDVPGAGSETRARVLAVAEELGYVPDRRARQLRRSRSGVLGVSFGLQHAFHTDLVEQLYVAAAAERLDLVLSATAPGRDERASAESLLRERPEGLLLLGPTVSGEDLATVAARVPTVVIASAVGTDAVSTVVSDDREGAERAVEHLVEQGHRAILHVDGGDAPGSDERRTGFRAATGRAGLRTCRVVGGGLSEIDGVRAAEELLDRPEPPTAVLAFNDACATGILDVVRRSGRRVPEDISVMGFDDSRLARSPLVDLTTVAQDVAGLARAAVAAALGLGAGNDPGATVLPPRLVVRSTTGPPPAGRRGGGRSPVE